MTKSLLTDQQEAAALRGRPHLSFSQIHKYLDCPEKYRLYYVEGLRPRVPSANLVFGKIVHEALAHLFQTGEEPMAVFTKQWGEANQIDLTYSQRDSWEKLNNTGKVLLEKFVREELPRIVNFEATEKSFSLDITSLKLPFVGIIDLIAQVNGKRTVVDFKTSASSYEEHEVILSNQLTAYQLAEPTAAQLALCVLVKTKEPRIDWHLATRSADALTRFIDLVAYVGKEIAEGRFFRRPGRWCGWCDYLPVCTGDRKRSVKSLIQVQ